MSILRLRNKHTNQFEEIQAIKGDTGPQGIQGIQGPPGENYVITSADYQAIANIVKDDIPTALSDLSEDSTHRTVTDNEKTTWNGKYNKPSGGIPKTDLTSDVQSSLSKADVSVNTTIFENSQAVQDNAINDINNEIDAFFKKIVSGTEIYSNRTLNWKLGLKINGNTGGVTGNNTIKIIGKNLYNKNIPTEHIYYDADGNPAVDDTRDFINQEIPVFDKISISYATKVGSVSYIRVIQYDSENNFVKRSLISANNQTIIPETNTARILVSVNAGPSDYFTDLQIERGGKFTTYSEYQSQNYPINLGNIVLNENDYIYKNNGNWYTKISGTDTQITDNDLIGQLNTIENNAVTYDEITYIYSDYTSSPIYFNADIYLSMTPDLTNYVKNDDFAQNSSIDGGVVRYANGVYGIRNVQNGYIGIVKPTDAEIEAQTTGWRVLTPAQLSKAVKEGITNNSITLTATEKDNIRKWLGVERSWKKIRTVTIPSDEYKGQTIDGVFYNYEGDNGIKNFSFHTDSDGNSLEGKGITGYVLRVTPTTNINVNQAFIGVVGNSMIIYTTNIKNTTSVFWYEFGIGPSFAGKTNNNPGQYQMGNRVKLGKELTSFIFNGFEATSVLGEGSKFEIWAYGYWD